MARRLFWSLTAVLIPFVAIVGGLQAGATAVVVSVRSVVISEVAWAGMALLTNDEWIELYNNTASPIDLTNWTLTDQDGGINILLDGTIPAHGFYLLERTDDTTVSDIPADQIYTGGMVNSGESLTLRNADNQIIDTANGDGGAWPAGSASPNYLSMERSDPLGEDVDENWHSHDGLTHVALDANGEPINGTPKAPNTSWQQSEVLEADLLVGKTAPTTGLNGRPFTYTISLQNGGNLTATAVILTDTLPNEVAYLYDSSGTPPQQLANQLVWMLDDLPPSAAIAFQLVVTIPHDFNGTITNTIRATTAVTETNLTNNHAHAISQISHHLPPIILIDALLYDGYELNDADEAVRLYNASDWPVDVGGWRLNDKPIPANLTIPPQQTIWLTRDAAAFARQFGFMADGVLPSWPGFANDGGVVRLQNDAGLGQDVLVYGAGDVLTAGWQGTAVQPYTVSGVFGATGQILYRQRDELTALPLPDTDQAADWAQTHKQILYPGWDMAQFFHPYAITETAVLTLAIAPDNAYEAILDQIERAQHSLQIESHTFENIAIGQALVAAAQRGVSVTLLLEGAPPGGLPAAEKYNCQQLEQAGGACYFMISDDTQRIADRYRFLHAKFIIVDGERVIISSENLSPNSLPSDDKGDGTWGRRGVVLMTDAPSVVAHLQTIFAADLDLLHADIQRWHADDPRYGRPPEGFVPITQTGGITYAVRYSETAVFRGQFPFEIIQSPENSLRQQAGLLGLLDQAGAGDTILVQQLQERPYWGASTSNPHDDPNPRLAAYIEAARRGAQVRLLLDALFDNPSQPTSNKATCDYVQTIAQAEKLDLRCALANPAGLGIHNKMILFHINGRGYIHVGSLNGTEQSHKGNREIALQVQSDEAYDYLADLFVRDWPHRVYLPLMLNAFIGPAQYPLISEVRYDSPGIDDQAEFVELVNPTGQLFDISGWSLSDAVFPTDYEDLRRFPTGTLLRPHKTLVIATTAVAFAAEYGFNPDFEILDSDRAVPDLLDDPAWGDTTTFFRLANSGDEVILRDSNDVIVDVLVYGDKQFPGTTTCPLVVVTHSSLERFPYWRDTNDCTRDFREWAFPSPGQLP